MAGISRGSFPDSVFDSESEKISLETQNLDGGKLQSFKNKVMENGVFSSSLVFQA